MKDFSQASLEQLIVHRVGNKSREEDLIISKSKASLTDEGLLDVLFRYFTTSFRADEAYRFMHEADLNMNEVYHYCAGIFRNQDSFYEQSVHLAQHLYNQSDHPKIKSGEMYLAYFKDCVLEDEITDAIGIFKSERRDIFLKPEAGPNQVSLSWDEGIDISSLDKGCIIFNTFADEGFRVLLVDGSGRMNNEAHFWKDSFLRLERVHDNSYATQSYLNMCKSFVEEVYEKADKADKQEQMQFLNKSMEYFQKKESFNEDEFTDEVMQDEGKKEDFKNYRKAYAEEYNVPVKDEFDISQNAVKKEKRKFRNLIKLDNNIEITIKTANNLIKKGYDQEMGMNYYMVYFNNEE